MRAKQLICLASFVLVVGLVGYTRSEPVPPPLANQDIGGSILAFTTISGSAEPDFPADGSLIPGEPYPYPPSAPTHIYTPLVFDPGATAVKHTGYFSDDYTDVLNRVQDANLGPPPYSTTPGFETTYYAGMPLIGPATDTLVRGTKYYWTVDETDALGNTFAGVIWEFTIQGFYAYEPDPPNEATFVETDVLLSWQPGFYENIIFFCHEIYMGTSWEDVNNAVYSYTNPPPEFLGTTTEPNILVTGLLDNTTYYWRVDEVDGIRFIGIPTISKGPVWSFTTISGSAEPNFPADGSLIPGEPYPFPPAAPTHVFTKLIFIPGPTAVKHVGYFSDNIADVLNRVQDANLGPPPFPNEPGYETTYYVGIPLVQPYTDTLVRGQKYYWTVDETDAPGNTFAGVIWEFTIQDYYASEPNPPNEATFVETDVLLSWQPGYDASHDIYMGTSWEDVNNAVYSFTIPPPELMAVEWGDPNYQATGLPFETRIYWRIDEIQGSRLPPMIYSLYKGRVWEFTTIQPDLNNDGFINFKDYAIPSNYWKQTGPNLPGDIYKDDVVDYKDLRILMEHWLWNL